MVRRAGIANIDPHLMLLLFLPVLLFESAFAIDMGILRMQARLRATLASTLLACSAPHSISALASPSPRPRRDLAATSPRSQVVSVLLLALVGVLVASLLTAALLQVPNRGQ